MIIVYYYTRIFLILFLQPVKKNVLTIDDKLEQFMTP